MIKDLNGESVIYARKLALVIFDSSRHAFALPCLRHDHDVRLFNQWPSKRWMDEKGTSSRNIALLSALSTRGTNFILTNFTFPIFSSYRFTDLFYFYLIKA